MMSHSIGSGLARACTLTASWGQCTEGFFDGHFKPFHRVGNENCRSLEDLVRHVACRGPGADCRTVTVPQGVVQSGTRDKHCGPGVRKDLELPVLTRQSGWSGISHHGCSGDETANESVHTIQEVLVAT